MTILLFVHGFRGSKDSFANFPNELSNYPIHHFEFPSSGEIASHVDALITTLLEYHTASPIIFLCHSMGGLLVVDTVIKLKSMDLLGSQIVVNGVIAFDSSFFGINSNTLASKAYAALDVRGGCGGVLARMRTF